MKQDVNKTQKAVLAVLAIFLVAQLLNNFIFK